MSGGRFDYINDRACDEIFGYPLSCDYGRKGFDQAKAARKADPFNDKQMSELCWDMFCLLHSLDWYLSCDTGEAVYLRDLKYFKDKWLRRKQGRLDKDEIDKALLETKEELYHALGLVDEPTEEGATP